jgi:hypothetical protein
MGQDNNKKNLSGLGMRGPLIGNLVPGAWFLFSGPVFWSLYFRFLVLLFGS